MFHARERWVYYTAIPYCFVGVEEIRVEATRRCPFLSNKPNANNTLCRPENWEINFLQRNTTTNAITNEYIFTFQFWSYFYKYLQIVIELCEV